jgi:hypothetical protein
MDCILDCDTLDCLGQALRDAYQAESDEIFPNELARLCAELEIASTAVVDGRH